MNKNKPKITVVFDTNVIFTSSDGKFFNNEIVVLLNKLSQNEEIDLTLCLPEVVLNERKYQIEKKAFGLLSSISKLEKLLEWSTDINKETIREQMTVLIQGQIDRYKIQIINIDTSDIDWEDMIHRSCFRLPPFSEGEEEKGFRDAIIAHTFLQFIESNKGQNEFYFVTKDGELKGYLEEKTKENDNVILLDNANELVGQINILTSTINEQTLQNYQIIASKQFFEQNNVDSLFYKNNIQDKILKKYKNVLEYVPNISLLRENDTWILYPPQFLKKQEKRFYWSSRISVPFIIYRWEREYITTDTLPSQGLSGINSLQSLQREISQQSTGNLSQGISSQGLLGVNSAQSLKRGISQQSTGYLSQGISSQGLLATRGLGGFAKKIISSGETAFDIQWSVEIKDDKLTSFQLEDISHLDIE